MSPMEQALRDKVARAACDSINYGSVYDTLPEGDAAMGRLETKADWRADVADPILAALTAALPAPGDAGEWVMVPRGPTEAMVSASGKRAGVGPCSSVECYAAMLSAAPTPPVSMSQAQAMREAALEEAAKVVEAEPVPNAEYSPTIVFRRDLRMAAAIRALAASPLPAPATPGGPDAE